MATPVSELEGLRQRLESLERTLSQNFDHRIPLLATNFDIEDAIFPPTVRVTNGAQSIPNNSTTTFTFSTETWDTDNMHSTSSNTSRLTATTAGKYRYNGHIRWDAHGTGIRVIRILFNSTTVINQITTNDTPNDAVDMQITGVYEFAAADYIELQGYQNRGAALLTETASGGSEFAMEWIAP